MDARLAVESAEAARLAEQLAALTGEALDTAVVRALAERIERERQSRRVALLADDLMEIGRRCAARLQPPFHSSDHADLYGEDGLPA
jgi:antitoxin VapB